MVLVAGCVRGSAGPVLRSQGSSEEVAAFALCARERCDRFQCLLRPGPAAASAGYVPLAVWGQAPWDCDEPRGRSLIFTQKVPVYTLFVG
jgi:hypothetical protein